MARQKMRKKSGAGIVLAVILIVAVAAVAGLIIYRKAPTSAKMPLSAYFGTTGEDSSVIIMLNGQKADCAGIVKDGRVYLPQNFVQDELNKRLYLDDASGNILYADGNCVITIKPGENINYDDEGGQHSFDVPVMIQENDTRYLSIDYVKSCSDMDYNFYDSPARVVIENDDYTNTYATAKKKIKVRYRGGVKSKILEELDKGTELVYRKAVDEWAEVQTPSGVVGYVPAKDLDDGTTKTRQSNYTHEISSIKKEHKISLVWFQVGGKAGNSNIDNLIANTSGINTISPTWYAVTSEDGSISDYSSADFVNAMHARGIEVWPLVSDFENSVNSKKLLSSEQARHNMIDKLTGDAARYGYDGINIDFERVTKDSGDDYLQFIRELSVECRRKNIVLSIDNYKAEAYNSHYDMEEQGIYADYVILMGYDEHYAGSESGSVASIGFVEDGIKKALKSVPADKLVNAVPFYTRIWTIKDGTTTSRAVGMQTAIDDLSKNGAPAIWDDTVCQYFGSYEKNGETVKIWVEEDRSIEEKLKVMDNYGLAGVGAWKLGLEKNSVWSVISRYAAG